MKFSLSWLKHFLQTNATLDEIIQTLIKAGIEVEGVIDHASSLKAIIVGHVIKAEKHPNADKLSLCMVALNEDHSEIVQVVCGAPNVKSNMKVAYARIGTCIPKTQQTLKKSAIRGVESQGMLCSFDELNLPGDSDGIIDLPTHCIAGTSLEQALQNDSTFAYLFDPIIEVSLTPNRSDWFSILGIARELSCMGLGTLFSSHLPENFELSTLLKNSHQTDTLFTIHNSAAQKCQFFSLVQINNVQQKETPLWMQERLQSYGIEPKNLLVDISNYVCVHLGQPVHIYDYDKIKTPLSVQLSEGNETIIALDGKEYTIPQNTITISSMDSSITLAGIMGGLSCAVDANTKNILVEIAHFDGPTIAISGQALNMQSHSRTRFERGVSPYLCEDALAYTIDLVQSLSSGSIDTYQICKNFEDQTTITHPSIRLKTSDVVSKIGVNYTTDQIVQRLEELHFTCSKINDFEIEAKAPLYRLDIRIQEDLIEEVLRHTGFEVIENKPLTLQKATHEVNPYDFLRSFFTQHGFNEIITFSMLSDSKTRIEQKVEINNPITNEMKNLRPILFPGLLAHIKKLAQLSISNGRYFEIGHIFNLGINQKIEEKKSIAGIVNFTEKNRHWRKELSFDFFDMKKIITEMFHTLDVIDFNISTSTLHLLHPGQSADLSRGRQLFASFGAVHPSILQSEDIRGEAFYFEIDFGFIQTLLSKKQKFKSYSDNTLQPIFRDFSFWIDANQNVDTLLSTILKTDKELIKDIQVFDVYQNKANNEDKKSIALQITVQPAINKSLESKDIDDLQNKIIVEVEKKCNAKLRG